LPLLNNSYWDFVTLHNAYMPYPMQNLSNEDFFKGTMAASLSIDQDIKATKDQIKNLTGRTSYLIAITEYAYLALSPYGNIFDITSFTSALYVADVIHYLMYRQDILMANYWSMTGNGAFGTMWGPVPRPVYYIFNEYTAAISSFTSPLCIPVNFSTNYSFSSPEVGYSSAQASVSPISGLAITSTGDNHIYLLILNKSWNESANIELNLSQFNSLSSDSFNFTSMTAREFYTSDPYLEWQFYDNPGDASSIGWNNISQNQISGSTIQFQMKPHSIQNILLNFTRTNTVTSTSSTTGSGATSAIWVTSSFAINENPSLVLFVILLCNLL